MRKFIFTFFIVFSLIFFLADCSFSQTSKKKKPDHSLSMGIIVLYLPDYEGSDYYEYKVYPVLNYSYKNVFFSATDGLGIQLADLGFFELSTAIGYEGGRDEDDALNLKGTGDLEEGAAWVINAELKYGHYSIGAKYQKQITGENTGYTVDYKLGFFMPMSKTFIVTGSLNATYGNDIYMEKNFGINSVQAANSIHDVYETDAGFKSAGAGLVLIFNLTERVSTQVIANYKRFIGDAKDSPIVLDKDQYFTAIGVTYKF